MPLPEMKNGCFAPMLAGMSLAALEEEEEDGVQTRKPSKPTPSSLERRWRERRWKSLLKA